MKYEAKGHLNISWNLPEAAPGSTGTTAIAKPAFGRNAMMRNFILQMGFKDPDPAVRARQYSALTFQPRVVLVQSLKRASNLSRNCVTISM